MIRLVELCLLICLQPKPMTTIPTVDPADSYGLRLRMEKEQFRLIKELSFRSEGRGMFNKCGTQLLVGNVSSPCLVATKLPSKGIFYLAYNPF